MKVCRILIVLILLLLLTQSAEAVLTQNGKDWIAQKFGIDNCYVESGLTWMVYDTQGNSATYSGGTASIVGQLTMTQLIDRIVLNGVTYRYSDLKVANDGQDISYEDVRWIAQNDGSAGEPQYCYQVQTPTPTPSQPNIVVSSISVKPYQINLGESVEISVTAENVGNVIGRKSFEVLISGAESDVIYLHFTVSPNEVQKKSITYYPKSEGSYTVSVNGFSTNFYVKAIATPTPYETPTSQIATPPPTPETFCGWSTRHYCSSDKDCVRGGCSGQVCQSKFEEAVVTTCEWKDCYNPDKYGLVCGCVNNECQWVSKEVNETVEKTPTITSTPKSTPGFGILIAVVALVVATRLR